MESDTSFDPCEAGRQISRAGRSLPAFTDRPDRLVTSDQSRTFTAWGSVG
jgi:hypothetical protein